MWADVDVVGVSRMLVIAVTKLVDRFQLGVAS